VCNDGWSWSTLFFCTISHKKLDSILQAHFRYVVELIENFKIDPQKMREVIMPSFAARAGERRQE
jgi:hypothetical protein